MKQLSLCLVALSMSMSAAAAPSFGFNQEFFAVCDEQVMTAETAAPQFEALFWTAVQDEDLSVFLTPDDILTKVNDSEAFEVELEDGGAWYGVFATGILGKRTKVDLCQVLLVTDDLTEWKDDFQSGLEFSTPVEEGSNAVDKRSVWIDASNFDDSTGGYIFREVSTDETSYISISRYWFK